MAEQAVRKTYRYKLKPTPAQEQALATVLSRCRTLDNTALEQRRIWWDRGQGTRATCSQQQAELPDLKAAFPDYAEVNAQVLQDVPLRRWTGHSKPASAVSLLARQRAIRASRAGSAITAAPTSR